MVIPIEDILGIEILGGRSMPLLFISAVPSACERIRKDLNLEQYKSRGLYYDLESNDDTMKKITMLPVMLSDETKKLLSIFYKEIITELDMRRANELLVKCTPKAQALQAQQSLQVNIYMYLIYITIITNHDSTSLLLFFSKQNSDLKDDKNDQNRKRKFEKAEITTPMAPNSVVKEKTLNWTQKSQKWKFMTHQNFLSLLKIHLQTVQIQK